MYWHAEGYVAHGNPDSVGHHCGHDDVGGRPNPGNDKDVKKQEEDRDFGQDEASSVEYGSNILELGRQSVSLAGGDLHGDGGASWGGTDLEELPSLLGSELHKAPDETIRNI